MNITHERVRLLLDYDPGTGVFLWKRGRRAGKVAGCFDKTFGYVRIEVDGVLYLAHRLAWLHQIGSLSGEIDHINLIRNDNRFCNLRRSSRSQNGANCRIRKHNKSGLKGAVRDRAKWRAQITHNSKTIHLGSFSSPEEAHAAYCEAAQRLFGEFARAA